jgi:hypothetical protein
MGFFARLFGTAPRTRDVSVSPRATAAAPGAWSYQGLVLGVAIEEFYCLFGEQIQALIEMVGDMPAQVYEANERKLQRSREILMDFDVPDDIVTELIQLEANVHRRRSSDPIQDLRATLALELPADIRARITTMIEEERNGAGEREKLRFVASTIQSQIVGARISQLMGRVRGCLAAAPGLQYDVGVFTARIGMCAGRILGADRLEAGGAGNAEEWRTIYSTELLRAAEQLARHVADAQQAGTLAASFEPGVVARYQALLDAVHGRGVVSVADARTVHRVVEGILAPLGFTPAMRIPDEPR